MDSFEDRVKLLEHLVINFTPKHEYRPAKPPRSPHDIKVFEQVLLPLSPSEWCGMCMRDGDEYVGGCCGSSSAIQDQINHWFRMDSGWVKITDLQDVAEQWTAHGDTGWDNDEDDLEALVNKTKTNWLNTSGWEKIRVVWKIVKDHYGPVIPTGYHKKISDIDNAVHIVSTACNDLSWANIFGDDNHEDKQNDASTLLTLNRILPALKTLWGKLSELAPEPFNGFAMFDKERGSVCSNRLGLCIYDSQEAVDKIMNLWIKQEAEYTLPQSPVKDKVEIRPIRISMEEGLVFTDRGDE